MNILLNESFNVRSKREWYSPKFQPKLQIEFLRSYPLNISKPRKSKHWIISPNDLSRIELIEKFKPDIMQYRT
jgi:hypothetical protein